jgi:hypothetical protein
MMLTGRIPPSTTTVAVSTHSDSFYDQLVIAYDRLMSVGAVLSTPVVDGNTIYFGSSDGQLYAMG